MSLESLHNINGGAAWQNVNEEFSGDVTQPVKPVSLPYRDIAVIPFLKVMELRMLNSLPDYD